MLEKALSKTIDTPQGKVAGKRILASLVVEGITTGKVTFPGDISASTLGVKDWMEFVKWAYQYLEPPISRTELTGKDGGDVTLRVIYDKKDANSA